MRRRQLILSLKHLQTPNNHLIERRRFSCLSFYIRNYNPMQGNYYEDQVYTFDSAELVQLSPGTYEGCQFLNGNFSGSDLTDFRFLDCTFQQCNLDRVKLINTSFSNVKFIDSKMMGIDFEHCHPIMFSIGFENCQLSYSNFFQRKMPETVFKNCNLTEVDFSNAILTSAVFSGSNFSNARFEATDLSNADFRDDYTPARDMPKYKGKTITMLAYFIARKHVITKTADTMFFGTFVDSHLDWIDTVHFP